VFTLRIIENLYLESLLLGKFVPVIVMISPPAGFILILGETLIRVISTTSGEMVSSNLTWPQSPMIIGYHDPPGSSLDKSHVMESNVLAKTILLQSI